MRTRAVLLSGIALALAIPALAQESLLPPGFGNTAEPEPQSPAETTGGQSQSPGSSNEQQQVVESDRLDEDEIAAPSLGSTVELPDHAKRDPFVVGRLDPVAAGLSAEPWGGASGNFLSPLMRRMQVPIASRWAHIALRNSLLAETRAPRNVNPVDWVAERAWLLLRMGEADAARMLVTDVDVERFTPKMFQVAVQTALATADPAGLCPLDGGIRRNEARIQPLVQAMCAAMAGEPESAAAQIDSARRRGPIGGIDLVLSEKIIGAGTDTGRAVTVEWEPVDRLNAWRFGLATATGMTIPDRLIDNAPARVRAWQARAPLLSPADRLDSALIATGLGVFSSQALIDLQSLVYESTGPDDLPETDAWQLRQAFVGNDLETRLGAMRRLWRKSENGLEREAMRAMLGRAAAHVVPDPELQADAPDLIASMLAAGYDQDARRWAVAIRQMDDEFADAAWAMLVLGSPNPEGLDFSIGRINSFIGRDESPGKRRSALLVAALAGLNRIDGSAASRLNERFELRIARQSSWTRMIDDAAGRGQPGTVAILAGTGMQSDTWDKVPSSHLFHIVAALRQTGQEYVARMVAAEALART